MTSSAWISGESSSPNAAWMPPCAFAELHAWSVVFVAIATRAPARSAETAAASPEAPLPMTSTSKEAPARMGRILAQILMRVITFVIGGHRIDTSRRHGPNERLHSPAHGNPGRDRQADVHHRRSRGHPRRGGGADERAERRRRRREGLRPAHRGAHGARHAPGDGRPRAHERRPRAAVDDREPRDGALRT